MKITSFPSDFVRFPHLYNVLELPGVSYIASFSQAHINEPLLIYSEDDLILFVVKGSLKLKVGSNRFCVVKNHLVIVKKSTYFEIIECDSPLDNPINENLFISLNESFLINFINSEYIQNSKILPNAYSPVFKYRYGEVLITITNSILLYLKEKNDIFYPYLFRIKVEEILFGIAYTSFDAISILFHFPKQILKSEIPEIMENNYLRPVTLSDLARMSGRSLSSFRRDFQLIYKQLPGRWIQGKRMEKAFELLSNNNEISISNVCYSVGYENTSHFSRLFKNYYGFPPSKINHNG
ncbi:helix-turn-helix domain-containing protein [Robertkochia solimangrovi]|uniref:helix-turn-helix domain-containing protein n=1 Tax=Robertkochia solimangrovi TaxID=2213046 RepID=UPI001181245B|nr:AraC family transcriptional regulator [Robertkochia solimangrovi]TRZ42477.1 AraC family transcriptional regulator [Robertkochia solimangrovi]